MRKFAHIINPVKVGPASDLFFAQPVTFESMRIAQEQAKQLVDVELYTAQYAEDRELVPEWFNPTQNLERSVLDTGTFEKQRKLPLLRDILDRLFEATDAPYLIYTNVDIALLPHFYLAVDRLLDGGYETLVINRRTIDDRHKDVEDYLHMCAKVGLKHPGHDCFVFKREACEKFDLDEVCIGMAWIAKSLMLNMAYHAERFNILEDMHLTFHIGDPREWKNPAYADYRRHNRLAFEASRRRLAEKYGPLEAKLTADSDIPPVIEEQPPWYKRAMKAATPQPLYEKGKRVYRRFRPLNEDA